jgi:hypothetical protein
VAWHRHQAWRRFFQEPNLAILSILEELTSIITSIQKTNAPEEPWKLSGMTFVTA